MRRSIPLRPLLVVIGLTLLLALPASRLMPLEGELTVVSPAKEPHTVTLAPHQGVRTATLQLLIRNSGGQSGAAIVRFERDDGRSIAVAGARPPAFGADLSVYRTGDEPNIAAFQVTRITLEFGMATSAAPTPIEGVVVVAFEDSTKQVRPAALRVTVVPNLFQSAELAFEPSTVTIAATCYLPWRLCRASASNAVGIRSLEPEVNAATMIDGRPEGGLLASARIAGERGGSLRLDLRDPAWPVYEQGRNARDPDSRAIETLVRASEIERAGTYTGSIALDPGNDEAASLAVTVQTEDFWLWPLVALLAGALVAWGLVRWRDQQRGKELLRYELKKAAEEYGKIRGALPPDEIRPYSLDHVFPPASTPVDRCWQCPPRRKDPPITIAETLYCQIEGSASQDSFLDLTRRVALCTQILTPWSEGRTVYGQLTSALAIMPEGHGAAIKAAIVTVLRPDPPPADVTGATKHLGELRGHVAAATAWLTGWSVYVTACKLHGRLTNQLDPSWPEADKAELRQGDPRPLLSAYLDPAVTLAECEKATAELRTSLVRLLRLAGAHPAPADEMAALAVEAAATSSVRIAAPAVEAVTADSRSAAQILADVRYHDWLDFWITFSLTVLAYFLTLYPDKQFGTTAQYLSAFAAGATGQLLVNWRLVPWFRSYQASTSLATTRSAASG